MGSAKGSSSVRGWGSTTEKVMGTSKGKGLCLDSGRVIQTGTDSARVRVRGLDLEKETLMDSVTARDSCLEKLKDSSKATEMEKVMLKETKKGLSKETSTG